ncbi:MAG: enoyl-ACP reductase FabI [bacterium]
MSETVFPAGELMRGKRGLVMGVANKHSIAWAISQQLHAQGAEMMFTYANEALERRVRPLVESLDKDFDLLECDVSSDASMDNCFAAIEKKWGKLDFLVHSIAFASKEALQGSFVENTSREAFLQAMDISAFSFVDAANRASKMMAAGGSMITLTYLGAERVIPNYNVMGVAKAALEASTRYIASDLGKKGIRANAISAGAIKTLSLAGISGAKSLLSDGMAWSPMRENTSLSGVAGAALYLLSDLGTSCTGETLHVDSGFHIIGMPDPDALSEA